MKTVVTVDSIDAERAVLDTPAGALTVPRGLLPPEAREGDRIVWSLEVDAAATEAARAAIAALRKTIASDADDVTDL